MDRRLEVRKELYARITAALQSDLSGWTWERQPMESVQGDTDKPSLHVSQASESEDRAGTLAAFPVLTFMFRVASKKVIAREEDLVESGIDAHLGNVRKFKESVERTSEPSAEADLLMKDQLASPMEWGASDTQTTSQTFVTVLTLTLRLRPEQKGLRA